MDNQKVFYKENGNENNISLEHFESLIFADLMGRHAAAHYSNERTTVPIKLSKYYCELKGIKADQLKTALKKHDGIDENTFTNNFKNELLNHFNKGLQNEIEEALNFSQKCFNPENRPFVIKQEELSKLNHEDLRGMANSKLVKNERLYFDFYKKTNLENLQKALKKISKQSVKIDAITHVTKHINLRKKYKYKTLVNGINEIYSKLKAKKFSSTDKQGNEILADWVNEAIDNYEVIGNLEYLINNNQYYQAVYNNFKNKI